MSADSDEQSRSMVRDSVAQVLGQSIQRGFFGTVAIEADVKDGVVMQVRERVERSHNRRK